MKYRCLRDCYVKDRLFQKGDNYNLPDDFPKCEKNFKLVDESAPKEEETPRELKPGEYYCNRCSGVHRESSKLGKRHLKDKKEK